jgi:Ni,Fe-hydrogenase III small subunit
LSPSIRIFLLECSGCGACALQTRAVLTKSQQAAGPGLRAVDTPAHADVLVLCGAVPAPLVEEVQRVMEMPASPCIRVLIGDCAWESGKQSVVPGCPPSLEAILDAIATAWKGRRQREEPR